MLKQIQKNWDESLSEYGSLHNENCCVNFEDSRSCEVGVEILDCCENMKNLKSYMDSRDKAILEVLLDIMKLLKEQELPRACEDYSNDLDERIHFEDGYTEAFNDLSSEIKKEL